MKRLALIALLLAACSSPQVEPVQMREPAPVELTAGEYWDAHPSDLHDLCAKLTVFANFVGWPNEIAYRSYRKSWVNKDYERGETDPPPNDAFAEAVARCGL